MTRFFADLWHRLNGYPEDPHKRAAPPFPARTYFLDGPLKDQIRPAMLCLRLLHVEALNGDLRAFEYRWETLYPRAQVAYMCLSSSSRRANEIWP